MRAVLIAVAAVSFASARPLPAADAPEADPRFSAERCFDLIALFDEIVQSRFDAQTLLIEDWALQEARRWRLQAETDCAAGDVWFGVQGIEDALMRIGVMPPGAKGELPDQAHPAKPVSQEAPLPPGGEACEQTPRWPQRR